MIMGNHNNPIHFNCAVLKKNLKTFFTTITRQKKRPRRQFHYYFYWVLKSQYSASVQCTLPALLKCRDAGIDLQFLAHKKNCILNEKYLTNLHHPQHTNLSDIS